MCGNINDISNMECIGCGVCKIACKLKCIEVKRNELGFYSSEINDECKKCGVCKSVCYKFMNIDEGNNIKDSKGYLAYSLDDNIRINSSSGGIGKELTKFAIQNGYEVCGATYDYDENNAKHIIITYFSESDKIVGSKYIPSYTVDAFEKLDKNKKYLIIGTPCQIYGLRKLKELNRLNKNVILVDFFCHGTPSLNLWDKYLDMIKEEKNLSSIKKVNFKDKSEGWHKSSIYIEDENNNKYLKNLGEDKFMQFFLKNLDLNESCYDCKLRFNKIYSDIRMGDFWGPKCEQDEKGTSIVLSNTNLGEEVLKELKNIHIEEITFDELKESQYIEKLNKPKEKQIVQKLLKEDTKLDYIYKKSILVMERKKKLKQGILKPYYYVKRWWR